ncbi:MAG: hypothetical protein ICV69_14390 [Thermoleophilaceae bacterium]|nr:hypothetical protein [Thermoleophilaceae bacterium]
MAARRTQTYFTLQQRQRLDEIRRRDGLSLAEVAREAIARADSRQRVMPPIP